MRAQSYPPLQPKQSDLIDFPVKLFNAVKTMRLYPATNPRVVGNLRTAYQAFKTLIKKDPDQTFIISMSEKKLIINDQHLSDKEMSMLQVKGIVDFFSHININALAFDPSFTKEHCSMIVEEMAKLLGQKQIDVSLAERVEQKNISSVKVDSKRYVAIHEGEQIVQNDLVLTGIEISDEDIAEMILGKGSNQPSLPGLSSEQLAPFLEKLSKVVEEHDSPEEIGKLLINTLKSKTGEAPEQQTIQADPNTPLVTIDSSLLTQLLSSYSQNQDADNTLADTVEQLSRQQINNLVNSLLSNTSITSRDGKLATSAQKSALIKRLLDTSKAQDIKQSIAQYKDAEQLLNNPNTTLADLPPHLLQRLQQPEWSAPVLANAIQQTTWEQVQQGHTRDPEALNRMLQHYEQLLDKNTQNQVAQQAGAQITSIEGAKLGNVLAQKFKGIFGKKIYKEVLTQISDELLDETIEFLNPKQLNRMVALLTSDIPLAVNKKGDPAFKEIDDEGISKLVNTSRGQEIKQYIAQNADAKHLLENPGKLPSQLPPHLLQRLKQPEWSGQVLANAVLHSSQILSQEGKANDSALPNLLGNYEKLLRPEELLQVAHQASTQLTSLDGNDFGKLLSRKFKGLFGEKLYRQILTQVSDELLDEVIEHLNPMQLNRMVAILTSEVPLSVDKNDADQVRVDEG